jgi:hypothetical protein
MILRNGFVEGLERDKRDSRSVWPSVVSTASDNFARLHSNLINE